MSTYGTLIVHVLFTDQLHVEHDIRLIDSWKGPFHSTLEENDRRFRP